jgi:hypothetical protein
MLLRNNSKFLTDYTASHIRRLYVHGCRRENLKPYITAIRFTCRSKFEPVNGTWLRFPEYIDFLPILFILLSLLGPLACFPSELIWSHESCRQLVGRLGRVILPVQQSACSLYGACY